MMSQKPTLNNIARIGALAVCSLATAITNAAIEEIVVTAERRLESVQDVSLSVSAFDKKAMARGGINDVSRIEFLVPGVNFSYAGNDAKFNVRGANSTNTYSDNGSIVGTFVDGVYKPRASQQTRAFFDVERIEFLKGPQGTLYGRNTFAGALNLYTNQPDLEGVSGEFKASVERFNTQKFEGFINVPISDTLAFRFAGFTENGAGYVKNDAGPDVGAPDDQGWRASVFFAPSEKLELILRASHITERGTSAGLFGYKNLCRNVTPQGLTDSFGSVRDCQNPQNGSNGLPRGDTGPWRVSQDYVPDVDLFEDSVILEIGWDAGSVAVKSISSYTDFENMIGFDFDFSQSPFNVGGFDETAESYTQELQFSSTGNGPLKWTAGAYYSHDETFFSFTIFNQTQENDTRGSVADPNGTSLSLLDGTPLVSTATSLNGFFGDSAWIETNTLGVFSQGEYSFSDNLRVIAGLRYNNEKKDLSGGGSNFTTSDAPVLIRAEFRPKQGVNASPLIVPRFSRDVFSYNRNAADANNFSESFDNVSWKVGVEYDIPQSEAMLYFTVATGFLSGSLNNDGTSTDEQKSLLYELGLKSILMKGALLFNAAAHYTEYTNLLTQFQLPIGNVIQTFSRNGGEIQAWGLELEAAYNPVGEWRLGLSVAYLNAEFGVFAQDNPYQLYNGEVQSFINVNGDTPGWSPDVTATITASYDFSLGGQGTLTPYLQFSYSDGFNTSNLLATDKSQDQSSYTKTDLRLVWVSPSEKFSVEGFIENIEDKAVLGRGNNGSDDNVQSGYLYPRNAGIRFSVSWN